MSTLKTIVALTMGALAASCSATSTAPAMQESRYGPAKGESEISFAASLSNQQTEFDSGGDQTDTVLFGQVGGGYFITDEQEVGGQLTFTAFKPDSGDDSTSEGLFPYYRWNFRNNERSWWYAGVQVGYQSFEFGGDDDSAFGGGVHGGFKSWITPRVAFFVEPRYNVTEFDFAGTEFKLKDLTTLIGLSVML